MTQESAQPPQVYTLFCDDVRRELGGKLSAMGIYRVFLGITEPTLTMPKLVALCMVDAPVDYARGPIVACLNDGKREVVRAELTAESAKAAVMPQMGDALDARLSLTIPIECVNFVVHVGMALNVSLELGEFRYTSEALHVIGQSSISQALKE